MMLIAFWFLAASMTLILGFYGSVNLVVGPNYSRLVHANSFFVQEIKVNGDKKPGPMLYGFSEQPPLDIRRSWNQTHHVLVPSNHHQEWMFWLNKGPVLSVSYNVKADDFSQLILIKAEGTDINSQNSEIYQRRLCAICFDDPRDSFFLPCRHCAACFTCGMRIAEESSLRPICRKKIRRVKKIFTF